jgi:hypothetical protein
MLKITNLKHDETRFEFMNLKIWNLFGTCNFEFGVF